VRFAPSLWAVPRPAADDAVPRALWLQPSDWFYNGVRYVNFEQQSDLHPELEPHLEAYVMEQNVKAAEANAAREAGLAAVPPFRVQSALSL
jgi:hypothetical protein